MLETLQNIFRIPDLRKRLIFVGLMLFVYRLGAHIHVPGVDWFAIESMAKNASGDLFGFLDMFSGRALSQMTVFALGIMPYISASIILQLLTVVVPFLERLSKEGELGKKKITQYTRYGTVAISIVQGYAMTFFFKSQMATVDGVSRSILTPGAQSNLIWWQILTVVTLTAGTSFIMWIGEQITERGIGNGISLLIFAGIIVGLPGTILRAFNDLFNPAAAASSQAFTPIKLIIISAVIVAMVAAIVFVERGQRRIPVSYAKRVVGRKMYGGQSTYIPLRINTAGVIPVIFASSILLLPQWLFGQLATSFPGAGWLADTRNMMQSGHVLYMLLYIAAIMFFCFFYTQIVFNPKDVADNMKKYGSFIPGKRPGRRTADYISTVLNRITTAGALYLALVAVIPMIVLGGLKVDSLPAIGTWLATVLPGFITQGIGLQGVYFGGTGLLIVIGVTMDFVQQLESQLIMRHYDGFFKGSRIRGRRG
jgi:preprotein translocase subunit SecY